MSTVLGLPVVDVYGENREDGPLGSVVKCKVCGDSYRDAGIKQHWAAAHDDMPRPWWPPKADAKRDGPRYNWARRRAFARDGSTCQRCGVGGDETQLEAHHIVPFNDFDIPGEAHAVENLVVLCRSCLSLIETLECHEQRAVLKSNGWEGEEEIKEE